MQQVKVLPVRHLIHYQLVFSEQLRRSSVLMACGIMAGQAERVAERIIHTPNQKT